MRPDSTERKGPNPEHNATHLRKPAKRGIRNPQRHAERRIEKRIKRVLNRRYLKPHPTPPSQGSDGRGKTEPQEICSVVPEKENESAENIFELSSSDAEQEDRTEKVIIAKEEHEHDEMAEKIKNKIQNT